jgi:2-haloacid dehalogenase
MKDIFLVDADDTVLDFHGVSEKALRECFKMTGLKWKEEYLSIYRKVNAELWAALERKELSRDVLMETRFARVFEALNIQGDDRKFNRLYVEYLSNNPAYLEGAEAFLQTLKKHGRVYIVTNGTEYVQRVRFKIAKLYERVDGVFISQTAGYDKPDPRYTQYVTERIENFDKERAVWIGDSLSADIKGANDAGITSIWYNPQGKPCTGDIKPNYIASDFSQIVKFLQIMDRE